VAVRCPILIGREEPAAPARRARPAE